MRVSRYEMKYLVSESKAEAIRGMLPMFDGLFSAIRRTSISATMPSISDIIGLLNGCRDSDTTDVSFWDLLPSQLLGRNRVLTAAYDAVDGSSLRRVKPR